MPDHDEKWSMQTITDGLDKFNTSLNKTMQIVSELDNFFQLLDGYLRSFAASYVSAYEYPEMNFRNTKERSTESVPANFHGKNHDNGEVSGAGGPRLAEIAGNIAQLGTETIKVREAFGELPPSVKKLKSAFGAFEDISKGIGGLESMFSGAEAGLTVAGEAATAGEIMTGAAGVAEAGSLLGPVGWVAGASALTIGGIASVLMSKPKEGGNGFDDYTADKWTKYYWDEEMKKDRKNLIALHNVQNYRQLRDVENELNKGYMVEDRMKRVEKELELQPIDFPELENIRSAHNKPVIEPEPLKPFLWEITGKTFDTLAYQEQEIRNMAVYKSMGGPIDVKKMNEDIADLRKKAKDQKPPIWRLPYNNEWLSQSMDDYHVPTPPKPAEPDKQLQHLGSGPKTGQAVRAGNKVININLNKPMIENFIINSKDTKQDLKDFKHKVEEVLLEILNSANAAQ